MRLANFIDTNIEPILTQWAAFARTNLPAATGMCERALRDHAEQMLKEIASDIRRPQNEAQRQEKSEGSSAAGDADTDRAEPAARAHALQRASNGFETNQMVGEYRALRATVLRLWSAAHPHQASYDLEDVIRFNEAIDAALAASLKIFLVEVDRTRDLFLGVLGHDLRGPLSVMSSCAQLDRRARPAETRPAMVLQNIAHMEALLDDLLEYARNRLGAAAAPQRTRFDLSTLARESVEAISAVTGAPIEFTSSKDSTGHWDYHRMHQVVSNLIYNAVKYGDLQRPITVRTEDRDSEVCLSVHNFGAPIAPGLLQNIFEPLVRGTPDPVAQPAGANLGLGLYAARQITQAHGGTISVASDLGGTRFEVVLPRGSGQGAS